MTIDGQPPGAAWTILTALQWTMGYFDQHGIENPRSDAEILLAHVLGCARIDLYLRHDQPLQSEELGRFKQQIQRRVRREPVAYIIGTKGFWSLDFRVTPDVLIPRPETEGIVEAALGLFPEPEPVQVLELGTGSGIISIVLANERQAWQMSATDISEKAIGIARANARTHGLEERIDWRLGHWFTAMDGTEQLFDLILSNPPYISEAALPTLEPEVCQYEPKPALNGGPDGLDSIRHIISTAPAYIKPGGWLLLEIGFDQGNAVEDLARQNGCFEQVKIEKDYAGYDRVARLRTLTR